MDRIHIKWIGFHCNEQTFKDGKHKTPNDSKYELSTISGSVTTMVYIWCVKISIYIDLDVSVCTVECVPIQVDGVAT